MQQLRVGTKLRQYKVLKVLGSGGFSVVYQAQDETLNKLFAIKEYFPEQFAHRRGATVRATSGEAGNFTWGKARFVDEAKILARFDHPNIVKVIQIFEANNTAYMVQQYLGGRDFKSWLAEIGSPPSQREVDQVVKPILDALEVIHRNELLHRDVAPDNIYIRDDGTPVLLDFGSAKEAIGQRTKTISAVVKDGYSPPEQYSTRGTGQGPWSDIYAFAATLCYAVTGARPDEAPDRLLVDNYVPARKAAKSEYRPAFLDALDWGLRLAPKDRPQSISAWRTALFGDESPATIAAPEKIVVRPEAAKTTDSSSSPSRTRQSAVRFGLFLGLMAIASALLSTYATVDPWGLLQTEFRTKVPLLPALYFAAVLCTGLYLWETKSLRDFAVVVGAVLIAWICAVESAFGVAAALDPNLSKGVPPSFVQQYAFAIAGAVGGFVGSTLTVLGLSFCTKEVRSRTAILTIVLLGTLAGPLLQIDVKEYPRVVFLVWQPLVAAAIGYLVVAPKLHRGIAIQVVSRKSAAVILAGVLVIAGIGLGFRQVKIENQAYHSGPQDPGVLKDYLASCWICRHRGDALQRLESIQIEQARVDARTQAQADAQAKAKTDAQAKANAQRREASQFREARGDVTRLRAYATQCQTCEFKVEALSEIAAVELRQRKELADQKEYFDAIGYLDRLQRYARECEICAYKNQAQKDIAKLSSAQGGGDYVSPAEAMRKRATDLLKTVYAAESADLVGMIPDIYASEVNYFGKTLLRDEVLAQVTRFTERWPQRHYVPRQTSLNVQCSDTTLVCTAAGVLDFEASNTVRNERSKGVATFEFTLKYASPAASPKITRENGTVVERRVQPLR